jgi:NAD(P)-dependent dehydrogenase (short-subunit alcohol dehydrogenase family)
MEIASSLARLDSWTGSGYESAVSRLANQSLVIIGGTSGLGLSAARAFVAEGAKVVVVGRDPEKVEAARKVLGGQVLGFVADATDPKAAAAAIQIASGNFGGFHGLYHVAGGSGRRQGDGPLHEITDEGWEFTLMENLTALFYSNRAAARQFLKQESGGSVLNMGSVLGFSPSPYYFSTHAYAAAKSAVVGFTKASAAYYAAANIRFNVLAPALVATPMSQRAQADQELLAFVSTKQPLDGGRIGLPTDLDGAAVFFMSPESKFITGQVLSIDGGWTLSDGQIPLRAPAGGPPQPAPGNVLNKLGRLWGRLTKGDNP